MNKKLLILAALVALGACSFNTAAPLMATKALPLETGMIRKQGSACSYYILGFIGPFGSNSLVSAARDGNISQVVYYDVSYDYWGLYGTRCREAYGY